jgi:peptide/nickel transport system permease protein
VIFGITVVAYFVMSLVPGNFVDAMLIDPKMTQTDVELMEQKLGLDKPVVIQYFHWLRELMRGNMGYSFVTREPVTDRILERAGSTLLLAATAMVLSYLIGIPIGVVSAVRQYSVMDYASTFTSFLGVSAPSFFIGLVAIYFFSLRLDLLPTGGMRTIGEDFSVVDRMRHLVLPATVLAWSHSSRILRYVRSSMLDVIHQDYIRTARSKGAQEAIVMFRHALPNALTPVITLFGLQFPSLLGGAIITETVFNWPGLGRLAVEAIHTRDYPVIMAINLLAAVMVVTGNLLADIMYGIVDPRIRYDE